MIAKLITLVSILTFSFLSSAALPKDPSKALSDAVTEGRVCKDCEARRILNDEWPGASPARRAEIAEQLTRLGGDIPALDSASGSFK